MAPKTKPERSCSECSHGAAELIDALGTFTVGLLYQSQQRRKSLWLCPSRDETSKRLIGVIALLACWITESGSTIKDDVDGDLILLEEATAVPNFTNYAFSDGGDG